jgi:dipeptidyl aminopeptidase/acylaminoacyl peptidase
MVMNRSNCWVASLLAVSALTTAFGQQTGAAEGAIMGQKPCVFGPYEEQSGFTRRFYSKEDYDYAKSSQRTECSRIEYRSGGLRVVGYLVRPRDLASRRFPVIIFNRGGFLDRGKIESFNLVDLTRLSEEGFVVLASQYRGNDGGEGREELGGTDLDDVSNLLATARSLPYTDTTNIFMYGVSRGGMMTFLEMKRNLPIRAAAVVGAVYDLAAFGARAPGVLAEAAKLIPDYSQKGTAALQERSVMNWPDAVNAPLLILHGANDEEVPAAEALAFATKFSTLKKPYELVVYAGDVHEVAGHRRERDARIVAWFKHYLR